MSEPALRALYFLADCHGLIIVDDVWDKIEQSLGVYKTGTPLLEKEVIAGKMSVELGQEDVLDQIQSLTDVGNYALAMVMMKLQCGIQIIEAAQLEDRSLFLLGLYPNPMLSPYARSMIDTDGLEAYDVELVDSDRSFSNEDLFDGEDADGETVIDDDMDARETLMKLERDRKAGISRTHRRDLRVVDARDGVEDPEDPVWAGKFGEQPKDDEDAEAEAAAARAEMTVVVPISESSRTPLPLIENETQKRLQTEGPDWSGTAKKATPKS